MTPRPFRAASCFFEAQRLGNLDEASRRIDWHGDSGLRDGADGVYFGGQTAANLQPGLKLDLTGGYHDATDVLPDLGGADTFHITSLRDSLLNARDQITDLAIGSDRIDGPRAGSAADLRELGRGADLTPVALAAVITPTSFLAHGAANFNLGALGGTRTFPALNDGVAGFQAANDAIVEITGFSDSLPALAIV